MQNIGRTWSIRHVLLFGLLPSAPFSMANLLPSTPFSAAKLGVEVLFAIHVAYTLIIY